MTNRHEVALDKAHPWNHHVSRAAENKPAASTARTEETRPTRKDSQFAAKLNKYTTAEPQRKANVQCAPLALKAEPGRLTPEQRETLVEERQISQLSDLKDPLCLSAKQLARFTETARYNLLDTWMRQCRFVDRVCRGDGGCLVSA